MKLRTPGRIFIPLTLAGIFIGFLMVTPSTFESKRGFVGMFQNLYLQCIEVFKQPLFWVFIVVAIIMLLIINNINKLIESHKFEALSPEQQTDYLRKKDLGYVKNWWQSSYRKQEEQTEEDIIIDHGFDGITELDNSLPQWWLALFYFGVVFCVVYMVSYSFTSFAHPEAELAVENLQLEEEWEKALLQAPVIPVEEAKLQVEDNKRLQNGEKIFNAQCVKCHSKDGMGGSGPNLTDDYWKNKEQEDLFKNIYHVVYNGVAGKAMQAWSKQNDGQYIDERIEDVASYVYFLNQRKPDITPAQGGKEPEGDLVEKWKQKK